MPKGRTKSKLSLEERRLAAFDLFRQGMSDGDVGRQIGVSRQTAYSYRKIYEKRLYERASANPRFFRDVVANTMRALEELDQVRADAWKQLRRKRTKVPVTCPHCSEDFDFTVEYPVSDQSRSQYHSTLLKAQEQRSKLLGVIGVKHEVFIAIMQVKIVADKLMAFMGRELCANDREKLEEFLTGPEMIDYMRGGSGVLDAIEAGVVEDDVA